MNIRLYNSLLRDSFACLYIGYGGIVLRLHYINTLKQAVSGTKAYEQTFEKEKSVINNIFFTMPPSLLYV